MNSPALRRTWEGQVVDGKFPLERWLGSSDHSTVFETALPGSFQKAAIKLITANTLNIDQLARWRSALKLSHPHLLRLFDMGRCEIGGVQFLYLVMEYAEEDLSQILPQRPLSTAEAEDLLAPALDALSYLHEKGFVHAAVKPSNLLAAGEQLKLSVDRLYPTGQTSDKAQPGTVYDAPELPTAAITPAADLWSLGVTIVEALTQHPPAPSGTREPAVPDTVPQPFRDVARDCLRRDPIERCSVRDIRHRLRPNPTPAPVSPEPPMEQRRPGRRPILAPLILSVLAAAAVVVSWRVYNHRDRVQPQAAATQEQHASPAPSSLPPQPPAQTEPSPARIAPGGEVVHQVVPDVPKSARNTIRGKIKVGVRVNVDASGKVTAATLTSAGPSRYFADLALRAARRWEFDPPVVRDQKIASTWSIRFQFSRTSTQAFPTRTKR